MNFGQMHPYIKRAPSLIREALGLPWSNPLL